MSDQHSDTEAGVLENVADVLKELTDELQDLYTFRNMYFETHPIEMAAEKNKLVEEKKNLLLKKFDSIDVDTQIPFENRAQFLYMKGRCYNISPQYDARATQCLSKAVKLYPFLVDIWNELGECYWKNMNVKDAKASLEGALRITRSRTTLRCLSIITRQENVGKLPSEAAAAFLKSVELAKEAVALDTKDGVSWSVLGNAYLCQFFIVAQDPATLKLCISAYKQALLDPVARGQPDLHYNMATALKYEDNYDEALEKYNYACQLDPLWEPAQSELTKLTRYLCAADQLVKTSGKLKTKKLAQMVQSIDKKMLGVYSEGSMHTFGRQRQVCLEMVRLDALQEGVNEGKVVLGKVVGSIHNDNAVPFTCAIVDQSMECLLVNVYNWADGRGAIIGDCMTIPEPLVRTHNHHSELAKYNFKSIRVNNPMHLLLNGKRVGRNQFASTKVTSTYEIH